MPRAPYTLSNEQRKVLCEWVRQLRFLDGYASNLGRSVDVKEGKLFGMKSHDYHAFVERLFPVAFKELLLLNVWRAVIEVSQFFRNICSTTLRLDDMVRLEKTIPEILCKLEKIFPPSFFNSMEHLPVHLPYKARVGGPVQYRWMYQFGRFLYHLRRKVGNKAFVEGSICNVYLTEEISNFCTHHFESYIDTRALNPSRHCSTACKEQVNPTLLEIFSSAIGYATSEREITYLDDMDYNVAHAYVLGNCGIIREYERIFEDEMKRMLFCINDEDVWAKYRDRFPYWFKEYVLRSNITHCTIGALACGPLRRVR
ncbi:hypothetical protein Ancab_039790 [Ancistrocladus abbreviatus]